MTIPHSARPSNDGKRSPVEDAWSRLAREIGEMLGRFLEKIEAERRLARENSAGSEHGQGGIPRQPRDVK